MTARVRSVFAGLTLGLLPLSGVQAEPDARLDAVIDALTPTIAVEAIGDITDPGRKLLALRSYLRAGDGIRDRWSWTEAEISAFQGSPAQAALLAEVEAIKAHFAAQNPGFAIYSNTRVRSLDVQIAHWNENASVGVAAEEIVSAFDAEVLSASDGDVEADRAARWLKRFRNTARAHLAAPGLTRHGRAHAIDFQISREDGTLHARADSDRIETVWRAEGWDAALAGSVAAAGPSFTGPLTNPNEPWHYDYEPTEDAEAEIGPTGADDR